jgi:hypothetical protein
MSDAYFFFKLLKFACSKMDRVILERWGCQKFFFYCLIRASKRTFNQGKKKNNQLVMLLNWFNNIIFPFLERMNNIIKYVKVVLFLEFDCRKTIVNKISTWGLNDSSFFFGRHKTRLELSYAWRDSNPISSKQDKRLNKVSVEDIQIKMEQILLHSEAFGVHMPQIIWLVC